MTQLLNIIYLFIPPIFLTTLFIKSYQSKSFVCFNLNRGLFILLVYSLTLVFVEGYDKPIYLESYLDAENYYSEYDRELLWGHLQIFLSIVLMKNEILYWLFYSFFYCFAYFQVMKKFFPNRYAGYFVLCAVGCMGFVSYGSNTIRAGFGIALLLITFCTNSRILKFILPMCAIGCQMSMLLPVAGYLFSAFILKKQRWCELIWGVCLFVSFVTSVVSDVMMMFGFLDARIERMGDYDGTSDIYSVGFRVDFIIYSLLPILFAKYNIKNMIEVNSLYLQVYRAYLLTNAVWLLLIRIPYSDRVAYLSWFMIPFLLLYPILNGNLNLKFRQRYVLLSICLFLFINIVVFIK